MSTPASVRIANRPAISLVDLSIGGALIDLPFQVQPDSRVTLEFRAASDRMMMPFRLLRCYVTSLRGGVRYQAAGSFDRELDWKPLLDDIASQSTLGRLIATLEAFLRHRSTTGRVVEFDNLLMWIMDAARRGESTDRIATEIHLRLTQLIPSVTVAAATKPFLQDPLRGARFFGLDFTCGQPLSAPDRRLLRAAAQLLSLLNSSGHVSPAEVPLDVIPRPSESSIVMHSVAEWQQMSRTGLAIPPRNPWLRTA